MKPEVWQSLRLPSFLCHAHLDIEEAGNRGSTYEKYRKRGQTRRKPGECGVQDARREEFPGGELNQGCRFLQEEGLQSTCSWQLGCHWVTLSQSSFRDKKGRGCQLQRPEQWLEGVIAVASGKPEQGRVQECTGGYNEAAAA